MTNVWMALMGNSLFTVHSNKVHEKVFTNAFDALTEAYRHNATPKSIKWVVYSFDWEDRFHTMAMAKEAGVYVRIYDPKKISGNLRSFLTQINNELERRKAATIQEALSIRRVYVWADYTWCEEEDIEDYSFKSDDHVLVEVPDVIEDDNLEDWLKAQKVQDSKPAKKARKPRAKKEN